MKLGTFENHAVALMPRTLNLRVVDGKSIDEVVAEVNGAVYSRAGENQCICRKAVFDTEISLYSYVSRENATLKSRVVQDYGIGQVESDQIEIAAKNCTDD